MADIENYTSNTLISGTSGDDSVNNVQGSYVTINTGAGDDSVENYYSWYVTINTGAGNDSVENLGSDYSIINTGLGNDSVENNIGIECTINTGAGDDYVFNLDGYKTTINTGAGNDSIHLLTSGYYHEGINVIQYNSGDGNDYIEGFGFNSNDTLSISGGSYSTEKSGDDVIVTVDDGKISLIGAASLSTVNIDGTDGTKADSKLITLTEGNDTYENTVEGATINALGGDDAIQNYSSHVSINAGKDNDTIYNYGNDGNTLTGGDGADIFVHSSGNYIITDCSSEDMISITSGAFDFHTEGDDLIFVVDNGEITVKGGANNKTTTFVNAFGYKFVNYVPYMLLTGTSGNDYIYNGSYCNNSSLTGNAGNDKLKNRGSNVMISGGDGKDLIYNEGSNVTISGGKGSDTIYNEYGSYGENVLFEYNLYDGNDVIYDFRSDSTLSISGSSYSSVQNGSDIIITVGDEKISLIGAASLSAVNIEFEKTEIETNSWKLDGSTATYGDLITVKGVKSTEGLSVSGKVVTVSKSSVNAKKITVSDGYTLALADDVSESTTKTAWSLSGTKATCKQTTTAGYTLQNNEITYNKKSTKTLVTVSGVKSTKGLSLNDKVVTVAKSSLNAKKITISDGYTLALADDVDEPTTKKASWALSGTTATYKSAGKTAGYTLASNGKSITYSKATTASTLATVKGAKSKSGLKVSGEKITLKKSALNSKVTVSGGYEFDFASDYNKGTITGSKNADTITARGKNISINGGNGDDTIKIFGSSTVTGGDGADIFYFKSSGANLITDYEEEDKISIASGTANIKTSGDDVIFTVGKATITVQDGKNKKITYEDDKGEQIYQETSSGGDSGVKFSDDGKGATLTTDYTKDSFTSSDYSVYKDKLITIDASAMDYSLEIVGNKRANSIIGTGEDDTIDGGEAKDTIRGSDGNDALYGGKGNDKLYGGDGNDSLWGDAGSDTLYGGDDADIFVYNDGDGNDVIADYSTMDKILVMSGKVSNPKSNSAGDVIYTVGDGQIVVKGGADKYIPVYYGKDQMIVKQYDP